VGDDGEEPVDAFIAAGVANTAERDSSFIGSGIYNTTGSDLSFIGSGGYANASGDGSFVGAGGYECGFLENPQYPTTINTTGAADDFIGAGDGSIIYGSGTFSGAGGTTTDSGGSNCRATVAVGVDSFVGAGDDIALGGGEGAAPTNLNFMGSGVGNSIYSSYTAAVGGKSNSTYGNDSFIGAGFRNYMFAGAGNGAAGSVIVGGSSNVVGTQTQYPATGPQYIEMAYIGGGSNNAVPAGQYATIGGGSSNSVKATLGSIGGGGYNAISSELATVSGGNGNTGGGTAAFAAGFLAQALTDGSFVWSDDTTPVQVGSTKSNQFVVRATGGVGFFSSEALKSGVKLASGAGSWSSLSDRTMKTAISSLDGDTVLAALARLPLSEWSYVSEPGVRHVGPMAQDFFAAYHVGEDDRRITTIDEGGVALSAMKALSRRTATTERDHQALRNRLATVDDRLDDLARKIAALRRR
jgi:hypothetical protein